MHQNFNFPTNEYDFETLCSHIARERFFDNNAQQYGRRGQKQWGVDIRATDRSDLKEEKGTTLNRTGKFGVGFV